MIYYLQSSGTDFKCEEEGFFSHPSDCKKYFWCLEAPGLGLVAHHFSCPSGLLFNKNADSCDYARNVYCSVKSVASTTTSTTTTEIPTTEKTSFNKVSSIYKNPSRSTPKTTTTTESFIDEIDTSDLEQEDPKVIKELIELIKKAGGIEELEKQINNQEQTDTSNIKSATTPATTINKSLVDKIKNRATLFKSRAPLFNGASQPEKIPEQKTSTTTQSTSQVAVETPKKYNTINRFSRPQSQNAGVDQVPESDAVIIEKPQYTSIARKKPVKPEVITENDYNHDPDRSASVDEESKSGNSAKKYTNISRKRVPVPVVEVVESDEDDEDEDEEEEEIVTFAPTTTTTKTPSKYINLNRRRATTTAAATETK